jgi:hypothetical protein
MCDRGRCAFSLSSTAASKIGFLRRPIPQLGAAPSNFSQAVAELIARGPRRLRIAGTRLWFFCIQEVSNDEAYHERVGKSLRKVS